VSFFETLRSLNDMAGGSSSETDVTSQVR